MADREDEWDGVLTGEPPEMASGVVPDVLTGGPPRMASGGVPPVLTGGPPEMASGGPRWGTIGGGEMATQDNVEVNGQGAGWGSVDKGLIEGSEQWGDVVATQQVTKDNGTAATGENYLSDGSFVENRVAGLLEDPNNLLGFKLQALVVVLGGLGWEERDPSPEWDLGSFPFHFKPAVPRGL